MRGQHTYTSAYNVAVVISPEYTHPTQWTVVGPRRPVPLACGAVPPHGAMLVLPRLLATQGPIHEAFLWTTTQKVVGNVTNKNINVDTKLSL